MASTWTTIHQEDSFDHSSDLQALRTVLEKGNDEAKIQTMQKILVIMLNGDSLSGLLMHIIRFVMPSKSKPLKKLLYAYWEICPKLNPDGKLKQEMILVCNAIRNDLQHPNEYICGMTLRFLCKLQEAELLEPLLPSCRACLTHRHSYVRKNAIFAIYSIYHHSEHLIPDAPDLVSSFLQTESDQICRRNAFIVLCNISHQRAVEYILQNFDDISMMDSIMQSAIIELIQKDVALNSLNKAKYLQLMFDFLDLSSTTVVYEAANTLATLTNNSVVLKAAASKFIELAIKQSDNNIKLIVLDKVDKLHTENEGILDDMVMEVLAVLSSTDLDVRGKALEIALKMVTSANVNQVLGFLEKELVKTIEQDYENNTEYRQLLIHAIHSCAVRYSEAAAKGSYLLMEHIGEFSNTSAVDVIGFIREVIEKFPSLRDGIIHNLLSTLMDIKAKKIFRGTLWILGEYCVSGKDIKEALRGIRKSVGELPILDTEQRRLATDGANETEIGSGTPFPRTSTRVLADGTYATESALTESKSQVTLVASKPPLRALILDGDYYLTTVLSSSLAKLVMRYSELEDADSEVANSFRAEAMLIMSSIIRIGQSQFVKVRIDEDSIQRIMTCFRALVDFKQEKDVEDAFLKETKIVYTTMLSAEDKLQKDKAQQEKNASAIQVDDVISIHQLNKKKIDNKVIDKPELNLSSAMIDDDKNTDHISSKLSRITQLTGFSDPVYAETFIQINKFDIILDVLLVNQTAEVLQNLSLEFAVLGDLKLLERPVSQTLAAHSFLSLQATVKVSSADTGVIFGSIVYERSGSGATEQEIVILNDIHIDVMDYIKPAVCTENQFRSMWTEFEWENKVNINSRESDLTLREYLKKLMQRTNMSCLTPEASLKGDCSFLSANLYAKSTFGEDVLANLSVEKGDDGKVIGHVRIRSKGQGIALSLGQIVVR